MKPENIILIIADTLRAKNLGLYGKNPSQTPNIDKLGRSGVVFANAYTCITCTDPAITSIMTGRYPLSAGLVNHGRHIGGDEIEALKKVDYLPEVLRKNNYKTMAIDWLSRWHKRGFSYYSGRIINSSLKFDIADKFPFPLFFRVLDKITVKFFKKELFIRLYYALLKKPRMHYDPADVVIDKGISLLEQSKGEKSFLYLHLWDAHAPHTRPKGIKSYLKDNVEDTYSAEINFMDEQIGRLVAYLGQSGQLEKTLIILTADHGENLYGHDIPFNHENLYDDVVKIPLIFSSPLLKPLKVKSLVQHIDIFPTVLDLLKIQNVYDVDGKSLLSLIKGGKVPVRNFAYFEDITYRKLNIPQRTRRRGIRRGKYKYIETLVGKKNELLSVMPKEDLRIKKLELFNLLKDPLEENNLSKKLSVSRYQKSILNLTFQMNKKRLANYFSLDSKVKKGKKIIEEATRKYGTENIAIAWKGGKDTTVLMHMVRTIFSGSVPFRVMFNDTTLEFEETYKFIKKMKALWNLDLKIVKHDDKELKEFNKTKDPDRKKELSRIMKITSIKNALKKYNFNGFMLGIRRDEHKSREKEKYFSDRLDHVRIHPLLDFTEKDIWAYIRFFGVPYSELYDKGYRSVGEKPFTKKTSVDENERGGRDRDKEEVMDKLRKLGYW